MSRIGKKTIQIPTGVTVSQKEGVVLVQGPKGELKRVLNPVVTVVIDGASKEIKLTVPKPEDKKQNSLWGTFAAHINNMIKGVTVGYQRKLEINGVGYKVAMQGADLKLEVGFSHPVVFKVPAKVKAGVEKNVITLDSADKELLGQTAASLRSVRKPEPYKGKGIKYAEETLRKKAGKSASKAAS